MAQSLSFRKNIISRPGDREVKGKMVRWPKGGSTLAEVFAEEERREYTDSKRLRDSAEPEEKRRIVR